MSTELERVERKVVVLGILSTVAGLAAVSLTVWSQRQTSLHIDKIVASMGNYAPPPMVVINGVSPPDSNPIVVGRAVYAASDGDELIGSSPFGDGQYSFVEVTALKADESVAGTFVEKLGDDDELGKTTGEWDYRDWQLLEGGSKSFPADTVAAVVRTVVFAHGAGSPAGLWEPMMTQERVPVPCPRVKSYSLVDKEITVQLEWLDDSLVEAEGDGALYLSFLSQKIDSDIPKAYRGSSFVELKADSADPSRYTGTVSDGIPIDAASYSMNLMIPMRGKGNAKFVGPFFVRYALLQDL